jgi:hypothetical protein
MKILPVGFGWINDLLEISSAFDKASKIAFEKASKTREKDKKLIAGTTKNKEKVTAGTRKEKKQKLVALLHGQCLKYGLRNSVYRKKFGTNNPYKSLFKSWVSNATGATDVNTGGGKYKVKIKICNLCLQQNGYSLDDILPEIKPVPFSISYLIEQQQLSTINHPRGKAIVIYDSPQ